MNRDIADSFKQRQGDRAPTFAATWQAAEQRYAARKTNNRRWLAAAALVAAVLIGSSLQAPQTDDVNFIEVADLLESTSWSAPSDVLLPEHQFDIYQDMPMLIESTFSAGGSLL